MTRIAALLLFALTALAAGSLDDAREAFVKGEYKKAIALAEPHLGTEPIDAWKVIGASSCFLKDKARAKEAYAHLDAKGQSFLKYVCSRNSVALP